MKNQIYFTLALLLAVPSVMANDKAKLIDELSGDLEFVYYGGGTIFTDQVPKSEYAKIMVIDAHDAAQYAKGHIPRWSVLNRR
jgi:hypothetical protein